MGIPVLTLARAGFALWSAQEATGVVGWDEVATSFGKILAKMAWKHRHHDSDALSQMIDEARANVPVDSGLLLNGITGEQHDDICVFMASAVRTVNGKQTEDYAHFVEFGTAAGQRGASISYGSREGLFSLPPEATSAFPTSNRTPRRRRQYREHPGTEAQPFFYPAAEQVLGQRMREAESWGPDAGREEGWDVQ